MIKVMIKVDPFTDEIIYPSSDGKRMAENTKQYRYITMIKGGLGSLFYERPDVLVVADLLWYPVEGNPYISAAPDTMVIFGRPKGDRMSYMQWKEENIPPQVVFEILSPSNTHTEMVRKLAFYEKYGVQEYYIYNPDEVTLLGYLRQDNKLSLIETSMQGFQSPLLGIVFEIENDELNIYRADGLPFLDYEEQSQLFIKERKQRMTAEYEKEQAQKEEQKAQHEKEQAQKEEQKAQHEKEQAQKEEQKAQHEKEQAQKEKQEEMLAKEEALAQVANLQELLRKAGISM
jgi:Uma2 family endonuclease